MNHDITENSALVPASSIKSSVPIAPGSTEAQGSFISRSLMREPLGYCSRRKFSQFRSIVYIPPIVMPCVGACS